ncbi:hypothetical protein Gasu2_05190 [Galdieria sulphuraria]|uniref:Uncharacterized protein n=1 Tax=Galdieria sulphuraria TaxID=130081 RepID=M2W982_GALSU|nr:uncharacterized protein Gasu_05070 [Galdieria sulphuraria]EME32421.1 hypothetical protein Gasu_05070 [Galdieria sulphuraria]GJD06084.1 hypothetical protein Gasu2_05190 [Galdieria sulphuraria]|eukprot:XP_005708941.1 hypothetical protein Gasu_05070 [Galdieria sulphuraria]
MSSRKPRNGGLPFATSPKNLGVSLPTNISRNGKRQENLFRPEEADQKAFGNVKKESTPLAAMFGDDSSETTEDRTVGNISKVIKERNSAESSWFGEYESSSTEEGSFREVASESETSEEEFEDDFFGTANGGEKKQNTTRRENTLKSFNLPEKPKEPKENTKDFIPPHLLVQRETQSLFERPCSRRMINWT